MCPPAHIVVQMEPDDSNVPLSATDAVDAIDAVKETGRFGQSERRSDELRVTTVARGGRVLRRALEHGLD